MKKYLFVLLAFGLVACDPPNNKKVYVTENCTGTLNTISTRSNNANEIQVSFITQNLKTTGEYIYSAPTPLENFKLGYKVNYTIKYCVNCFENYSAMGNVIKMEKVNE